MNGRVTYHPSREKVEGNLGEELTTSNPSTYVIAGREITIFSDPRVFRPTLTTWLLTERVLTADVSGKSVLDLGCGSGPIAIRLALAGASHVHATDLMAEACSLARKNAEANGVASKLTILRGDLFRPLGDMKFDVIVDDVSGVAESVARFSSWFPEGVPLGGVDGTTETIRMLRDAEAHLNPGGQLYFPVLSLSASAKIVEVAVGLFGSRLTRVASKLVPFNKELKDHLENLVEMRNLGLIRFDQIRTRLLWTLDIYCVAAART